MGKHDLWQTATLVSNTHISINVHSLVFSLETHFVYQSGQHCDIRLRSEDGYIAERSYSLLSAPVGVKENKNTHIEFGVQLLPDGEVSPYLCSLEPGDKIEIRGPIGGHFILPDFEAPEHKNNPIVLIGGGSGMVPLISMTRYIFSNFRAQPDQLTSHTPDLLFLTSTRTVDHIVCKEELLNLAQQKSNFQIVSTLTQSAPPDWKGYSKRVDTSMLEEVFQTHRLSGTKPYFYICGPTPFVEAVAGELLEMGFDSDTIKTERFGGA